MINTTEQIAEVEIVQAQTFTLQNCEGTEQFSNALLTWSENDESWRSPDIWTAKYTTTMPLFFSLDIVSQETREKFPFITSNISVIRLL